MFYTFGNKMLQDYCDNPTYIHPPRKFLIIKILEIWAILFVFYILTFSLFIFINIAIFIALFFYYKPVFKLWNIYYKKSVLIFTTILYTIICFKLNSIIRKGIWGIIEIIYSIGD